jgi:hypothetical protein
MLSSNNAMHQSAVYTLYPVLFATTSHRLIDIYTYLRLSFCCIFLPKILCYDRSFGTFRNLQDTHLKHKQHKHNIHIQGHEERAVLGRPHTNCVKTWDKRQSCFIRDSSASWLRPVCGGFHNLISFNCAPFFGHVADIVSWRTPVCGLPYYWMKLLFTHLSVITCWLRDNATIAPICSLSRPWGQTSKQTARSQVLEKPTTQHFT